MSDRSKIEWTDASWNPIRALRYVALPGADESDLGDMKAGWYCEKISPGCANCYAEPMNRRLGSGLDYKPGHRGKLDIVVDEKALAIPLKWRRPRKVFVCSMTDLFGAFVSDEMIDQVFAVMALCPQHTFQVLTKRPKRMRAYFHDRNRVLGKQHEVRAAIVEVAGGRDAPGVTQAFIHVSGSIEAGSWKPLPNVWLGVSAEDQRRANERVHHLVYTPAAVRFLSYEPALSAVDLTQLGHDDEPGPGENGGALNALTGEFWIEQWWDRDGHKRTREVVGRGPKLNWVICGGESGPNARPMHPDWARSMREQCAAADVPFFFKQWGEWASDFDDADFRAPRQGVLNGESRTLMARVGKAAAGRLLDGVQHDGFPENRP